MSDEAEKRIGFTEPNYTQTPNELFDVLMADMGEAELRVVLVAIRKTLGWHKQRDAISLSQFEKMSGLSHQGAIDGIAAATKRGLLREVGTGKRGVKIYELVISVDESTTLTSQANGLITSQASRPVSSTSGQAGRLTKQSKPFKQNGKRNYDGHHQNERDKVYTGDDFREMAERLGIDH